MSKFNDYLEQIENKGYILIKKSKDKYVGVIFYKQTTQIFKDPFLSESRIRKLAQDGRPFKKEEAEALMKDHSYKYAVILDETKKDKSGNYEILRFKNTNPYD